MPLNLAEVREMLIKTGAQWLWFVHCETSTGILNPLGEIQQLCRELELKLCSDCISSVGTVPVLLSGVYLASCASGKGLRSYSGVSMVFHNHEVSAAPDLPKPGRHVTPADAARMPKLVAASGSVFEAEPGAHHFRLVGLEITPQEGVDPHEVSFDGRADSSDGMRPVVGMMTIGQRYFDTLGVSLKGSTVSVTFNNSVVLGYVYNADTVDGRFGLLAELDVDDPHGVRRIGEVELAVGRQDQSLHRAASARRSGASVTGPSRPERSGQAEASNGL
jgi:hypothetical protein